MESQKTGRQAAGRGPDGAKAAGDRAEREAAALRENLRRRKEQARAREAQPPRDDEPCR